MTYPPILAAMFVFWPLVTFLGAQGFAVLIALAGLPALAWIKWRRPEAYALAAFAAVGWMCLSAGWSPDQARMLSGTVSEGTFSIESAAIRIFLTFLLGVATVAAAARPAYPPPFTARDVMLAAFGLHGASVVVVTIWSEPLLALFYPDPTQRAADGIQNILRNANAFAFIAPVLTIWLWMKVGLGGRILAGVIALGAAGICLYLGTLAGVLTVLLATGAVVTVHWLPRSGFRLIGGAVAGYILTAPILMPALSALLLRLDTVMPASAEARAYCWQYVGERIFERPVLGHGLGATGTWRVPFSERPDWLAQIADRGGDPSVWAQVAIVPGHPHNMALELWAETGGIGAILSAVAIVLLAKRLPEPHTIAPVRRYVAAGLIGGMMSLFIVAYSIWNEAYWAMVALATAGLFLFPRFPEIDLK